MTWAKKGPRPSGSSRTIEADHDDRRKAELRPPPPVGPASRASAARRGSADWILYDHDRHDEGDDRADGVRPSAANRKRASSDSAAVSSGVRSRPANRPDDQRASQAQRRSNRSQAAGSTDSRAAERPGRAHQRPGPSTRPIPRPAVSIVVQLRRGVEEDGAQVDDRLPTRTSSGERPPAISARQRRRRRRHRAWSAPCGPRRRPGSPISRTGARLAERDHACRSAGASLNTGTIPTRQR